jgi:hypothetical protein
VGDVVVEPEAPRRRRKKKQKRRRMKKKRRWWRKRKGPGNLMSGVVVVHAVVPEVAKEDVEYNRIWRA